MNISILKSLNFFIGVCFDGLSVSLIKDHSIGANIIIKLKYCINLLTDIIYFNLGFVKSCLGALHLYRCATYVKQPINHYIYPQ